MLLCQNSIAKIHNTANIKHCKPAKLTRLYYSLKEGGWGSGKICNVRSLKPSRPNLK